MLCSSTQPALAPDDKKLGLKWKPTPGKTLQVPCLGAGMCWSSSAHRKPQCVSAESRSTFLSTRLVSQLPHICKMSREDAASVCACLHICSSGWFSKSLICQRVHCPHYASSLKLHQLQLLHPKRYPEKRWWRGTISHFSSRGRPELALKDSYSPKAVDFSLKHKEDYQDYWKDILFFLSDQW